MSNFIPNFFVSNLHLDFIDAINKRNKNLIKALFFSLLLDYYIEYQKTKNKNIFTEIISIFDSFSTGGAFWENQDFLNLNKSVGVTEEIEMANKIILECFSKKLRGIISESAHHKCCWEDTMNKEEIQNAEEKLFNDIIDFVEFDILSLPQKI